MATAREIMEEDLLKKAGIPTIGKAAAFMRPMDDPVETVIPGAAGFSRWTVPDDAPAGAQSSVTLQRGDIDRVMATRAADAAAAPQGINVPAVLNAAFNTPAQQAMGQPQAAPGAGSIDANGDGIPDGAQISRVTTMPGADGSTVRTTARFTKGPSGVVSTVGGGTALVPGSTFAGQERAPVTAESVMAGDSDQRGVTGFNQGIEDLLITRGMTGRDTGARQIAERIMSARQGLIGKQEAKVAGQEQRGQELALAGMQAKAAAEARKPIITTTPGGKTFISGSGQTIVPEDQSGASSGFNLGDTVGGVVVTGFDSKGRPTGSQPRAEQQPTKPLDPKDVARFTRERETLLDNIEKWQAEADSGNKREGLFGEKWTDKISSARARLAGVDAALEGKTAAAAGGAAAGGATPGSEPTFATIADAEAAKLPKGTVVIINGRKARIN